MSDIEEARDDDDGLEMHDNSCGECGHLYKPGDETHYPECSRIQVDWQPEFSRWRHGGWYVDNLQYPSGAVGCVSSNYPDGKWRIACDPRPFDKQPTFRNRTDAAFAERELIADLNGGAATR